ncbi:17809_t:CDS:1, partial [Cetraspora pellucida]
TNPKRQAFYFYQYLTIYQNTAAENHNIDKMNKQQAINFLIPKLIDTNFLACIITYFDCTCNESPNYSVKIKFYKEKALPEAEQFYMKNLTSNLKYPHLSQSHSS